MFFFMQLLKALVIGGLHLASEIVDFALCVMHLLENVFPK